METLLKDSAAIWGIVAVTMISVGMYIYNSSMNSIYSAADQISTQEQQAFNTQWESFEGAQTGASVKSLISKLISNASVYEGESEKLPDLYYEPNEEYATSGDTELKVISDEVDNAISGFNKARVQIENKHTYYVEIHYSDENSLVDAIYIHYYEPNVENDGKVYYLPSLIENSYVDNFDITNTEIN